MMCAPGYSALFLSQKRVFTVFAVFFITVIATGAFFTAPESAYSIPHFAAMNGTMCIGCHITAQGGGLRTYQGWKVASATSILKPEWIGLDGLYRHDGRSNTLLKRRLTLGGDFRLQAARSHKSADSDRRVFPMQAALYADYRIIDWLHFEGSYNFGPKKFDGQQWGTASAIIQPRFSYTQVRAGFFQPSIGSRYDDHTMLVRQVPGADGTTIISPNFAEFGLEGTFNRYEWLSLTAGIFDAGSLAENFVLDETGRQVPLIDNENNPSLLGRVVFYPMMYGDTRNTLVGISHFFNGDFSLSHGFAGIGFGERVSVLADYGHSKKSSLRVTDTFMLELSWAVRKPMLLILRGERGETVSSIGGNDIETHTNQGLIGAQIFLLPYVEVRPEYRIVDTERFRSKRWAVQVHIFR